MGIMNRCDIYYDKQLISSEDIIRKYLSYFSSQFEVDQKTTSFAFHTGSLCFDMASVAALTLACFIYNISSNEDILQALNIGDMVLYKGERYRWYGVVKEVPGVANDGAEYIHLVQDGKGKNGPSNRYIIFETNKEKIRPYYGNSVVTDGRGIRRKKTSRNEFLSYVLDIPENEIPSTLDISVVVITEKTEFVDICQHLFVAFKPNERIPLTDIVPVSYFTSTGEEMQIGGNSSKSEAVIKAVSKVSAARELILNKRGNKVVGLLALNAGLLSVDASDFKDLIRRKSLRFAIITSRINAESSNVVVNQYEDANIFACTRDVLSSVSTEIKSFNRLTNELNCQIQNIVSRKIEKINVLGGWSWEEYKTLKEKIYAIRKSSWNEDEKEEFILSSVALLNLFTSAFFSMEQLEGAIAEGKINSTILSPTTRFEKLQLLATNSHSMQATCELVISALRLMYTQIFNSSEKSKKLKELLVANRRKKIAFVVPKAYYSDLYELYFRPIFPHIDVTCYTANRFDAQAQFDLIIQTGDVVGKRFDSLQCYASSQVVMLMYKCENELFMHREHMSSKNERKLNARINGLKGEEYEHFVTSIDDNDDISNIGREFADLDKFVEQAGKFDIRKLASSGECAGNSTGMTEVNYVGVFTTGEQILFSKYYSAVVFDRVAQKVTEFSPEKLSPGDVLVFTKRNDYTKNIVDLIFEQLLQNKRLDKDVQEAAEKAVYWKASLREYKSKQRLTYRGLAKEFKKHGSTLQEVTIRQWLDEDSHIVGPRNEATMKIIAQITKDPFMMNNPEEYFQACRVVRHYRREMLSLIAQAINDKLSNKVPDNGSVFEIVYDNVEHLSETLELDKIYELDEIAVVSCSLANRPIIEAEVLL